MKWIVHSLLVCGCCMSLFAQTSGATAPEVTSFEPVGTTDMVSLYSGDFSYTIPAVNVPGPAGDFSMALGYHAGIQVGEEASWVGLGWNMQPGAIVRARRGVPDDFNGDRIKIYKRGGRRTQVNLGISLYNLVDLGASYHSHNGLSGEVGFAIKDAGSFINFALSFAGAVGGSGNPGASGKAAQAAKAPGIDFKTISKIAKTGQNLYKTSQNITNLAKIIDGQSGHIGISLPAITTGKSAGKQSATGESTITIDDFNSALSTANRVSISAHTDSGGRHSTGLNISIPFNAKFVWGSINIGAGTYYWEQTRNEYSIGYLHQGGTAITNIDGDRQKWQNEFYKAQRKLDQDLPSYLRGSDINFVQSSEDLYSVSGPGLMGTFRPFRMEPSAYQRFTSRFTGLLREEYRHEGPVVWAFNGGAAEIDQDGGTYSRDTRQIDPQYDHTGKLVGFRITKKDGMIYEFMQPVYIRNEYTESASRGREDWNGMLQTEPYAYAWNLTAMKGSDYYDYDQNGEVSDRDWGFWVKFNYSDPIIYRWRGPWNNFGYAASISPSIADMDMPFHSFYQLSMGTKEVRYLASVETATHRARFNVSNRDDAGSAVFQVPNTLADADNRSHLPNRGGQFYVLQKLDRLIVQKKADSRVLNGMDFEYNYELNPGRPNSRSGALTLKAVRPFGRDGIHLPGYQFDYAADEPSKNPAYVNGKRDQWGFHSSLSQASPPSIAQGDDDTQFRFFHYATSDTDAAAWSLRSIRTPLGSHINIDYEADTFKTIENSLSDPRTSLRQTITIPASAYTREYVEGTANPRLYRYYVNLNNVTPSDRIPLREALTPNPKRSSFVYGTMDDQPFVGFIDMNNSTTTVRAFQSDINRTTAAIVLAVDSEMPTYGGGVRVKRISITDPLGSEERAIRYYYNLNPDITDADFDINAPLKEDRAWQSSGVAHQVPLSPGYAILQDEGLRWGSDFNTTGAAVGYARVIVEPQVKVNNQWRPFSGRTVHDFYTPRHFATQRALNLVPGEQQLRFNGLYGVRYGSRHFKNGFAATSRAFMIQQPERLQRTAQQITQIYNQRSDLLKRFTLSDTLESFYISAIGDVKPRVWIKRAADVLPSLNLPEGKYLLTNADRWQPGDQLSYYFNLNPDFDAFRVLEVMPLDRFQFHESLLQNSSGSAASLMDRLTLIRYEDINSDPYYWRDMDLPTWRSVNLNPIEGVPTSDHGPTLQRNHFFVSEIEQDWSPDFPQESWRSKFPDEQIMVNWLETVEIDTSGGFAPQQGDRLSVHATAKYRCVITQHPEQDPVRDPSGFHWRESFVISLEGTISSISSIGNNRFQAALTDVDVQSFAASNEDSLVDCYNGNLRDWLQFNSQVATYLLIENQEMPSNEPEALRTVFDKDPTYRALNSHETVTYGHLMGGIDDESNDDLGDVDIPADFDRQFSFQWRDGEVSVLPRRTINQRDGMVMETHSELFDAFTGDVLRSSSTYGNETLVTANWSAHWMYPEMYAKNMLSQEAASLELKRFGTDTYTPLGGSMATWQTYVSEGDFRQIFRAGHHGWVGIEGRQYRYSGNGNDGFGNNPPYPDFDQWYQPSNAGYSGNNVQGFWLNALRNQSYDRWGRVLTAFDDTQTPSSIKYGYGEGTSPNRNLEDVARPAEHPVAKFANATFHETFYEGFEEDYASAYGTLSTYQPAVVTRSGTLSARLSRASQQTNFAYAGRNALRGDFVNIIRQTVNIDTFSAPEQMDVLRISGLTSYRLQFFTTDPEVRVVVENQALTGSDVSVQAADFGWFRVQATIHLGANSRDARLHIDVSSNQLIDEIVLHPLRQARNDSDFEQQVAAQVNAVTYGYNNYTGLLTSITDIKGETLRYEYDAHGRLIREFDADGNLRRQHSYTFADEHNQP